MPLLNTSVSSFRFSSNRTIYMATTNEKRLKKIASASRKLLPVVSCVCKLGLPERKQLLLALDALLVLAEEHPNFGLLVGYKAWVESGDYARDVKGL